MDIYDLMYGLNDVSDFIVIETQKRSSQIKERAAVKWLTMAACICLVVGAMLYSQFMNGFFGIATSIIPGSRVTEHDTGDTTADVSDSDTANTESEGAETDAAGIDEGNRVIVDTIQRGGVDVVIYLENDQYCAEFEHNGIPYELYSYSYTKDRIDNFITYILGSESHDTSGYRYIDTAVDQVLGYSITRIDGMILLGHSNNRRITLNYYTVIDGEEILLAEASSYNDDELVAYSIDIDGDGADEFIAGNTYAYGGTFVCVYLNNNDVIEIGRINNVYIKHIFGINSELNADNCWESFDKENKAFVLTYYYYDEEIKRHNERKENVYGLEQFDFYPHIDLRNIHGSERE